MYQRQSITQDEQQKEWLWWIKHLTALKGQVKQELLTEAFQIFQIQTPCWKVINNEPDFTSVRRGELGKWDVFGWLWGGPTEQAPQDYFTIADLNRAEA